MRCGTYPGGTGGGNVLGRDTSKAGDAGVGCLRRRNRRVFVHTGRDHLQRDNHPDGMAQRRMQNTTARSN